ncbi:MAG TPA: PP2C family protein-serine/threonine phosphatase [Streptomyces sp.]|uniref:PP2C family protein-serine/threonine phosphatase n=1 Tax=Streptomyces sp. TaxID=1931 RepID=UPI002D5CEA1F|nr:PP2C family protein-serine/threonine phosphatase [Streptomyces sp.]HZG04646.1 PP2C family protein-serine/threonine phosphatase [Streptomyces sp.]
MSAQQPPKLAGINSPSSPPHQTVPPSATAPHQQPTVSPQPHPAEDPAGPALARPVEHLAAVQDRLAGWISDLTTLHDLTERLVRTDTLDGAVRETLTAGAALVGARRGLVALEPADGLGPDTTVGLGLGAADLGHIETVPRDSASYARLLDGLPEAAGPGSGDDPQEIAHPHIARDTTLDPRHREVAARLGYAASYAVPLVSRTTGRVGAAVWLYDEPAQPTERQRHLLGLYVRHAAEHIARQIDLTRARAAVTAVREDLLPGRLPRVPGVRLAVRHRTGPRGGGDWYDVLPLPEGALGLSVGGVTGSGPDALAAMGRLRASLRAYAVMEGEDPVAVLSDLELLLRLTEPARAATALFGYAERAAASAHPAGGGPGDAGSATRIVMAGAGHCPPLVVGPRRTEFAETTLSAPLGMLSCWEAPSIELLLAAGETLLLYSDGLLHRTGESMDRAFARLRSAAAGAAPAVRDDPEALVDHVLHTVLPDGRADADSAEDVVLLAARF